MDLSGSFVIGISSRALFDLTAENQIFASEGAKAYSEFQLAHENDILKPGAGFGLIKTILKLNEGLTKAKRRAEVILMSRNNADVSLRIFNSIAHYKLDIIRACFTSGAPLAAYLDAFGTTLFLSASEEDIQAAANAGFAAGLIYPSPAFPADESRELRVAFDGDAVLFSDESERIYKEKGIEAFLSHETLNARKLLPDGPFARVFRALALLQKQGEKDSQRLIRTALVTARNSPAHERVIRTLRAWGVRVDEAFFLGGLPKQKFLQAFRPHIFFDDQDLHCRPAAEVVPTARVLTSTGITASRESVAHEAVDKRAEASVLEKKPPAFIRKVRHRITPTDLFDSSPKTK